MKILLILLFIALLFRNKREGNARRKVDRIRRRTGSWQAIKLLLSEKANKRMKKIKKRL